MDTAFASYEENVRAARLRKQWSQDEAAQVAGVARATIADIERGYIGTCKLQTLAALAEAYDVHLASFFLPPIGPPSPRRRVRKKKQA